MIMAKNNDNLPDERVVTDAQKRLEKYYKGQEKEKKGKAAVASIITFSVVCFLALLVLVLKLKGVGKTVVFSTDDSGTVQTTVADQVEGTNLAEYIADRVQK